MPGLSELFSEADRIGDKYLTPESLQAREAELTQLRLEIWMLLSEEEIAELS